MMHYVTSSLAYVTDDLPGIGGRIKQRPEDFVVDEQPLYEPVGEGEHLMLFIEKRGQTTSDVARRIAKMFHVRRSDIGHAGLKDKHAVTRQHLSVYLPDSSLDDKYLSRFEFTPFKLLWAQRHTNKLRRGHLSGNRFVIYIREVMPQSVLNARAVLDRLSTTGVPNYVGHQRFGYRQFNHEVGRLLLLQQWQPMLDLMLGHPIDTDAPDTRAGRQAYEQDDYRGALDAWPKHLRHDRQALDALRQGKSPPDAAMSVDMQQLEYLISALQSGLFNVVLDRRVRDGLIGKVVAGDLAWKHDNRSVFAVDDATASTENAPGGRVGQLAISPSGPMWGRGMTLPGGQVLQWELDALAQSALSETDFAGGAPVNAAGSRRAMRIELRDPEISGGGDEHGPYVRVSFELTRGAFATTVLREIMKNDDESELKAPSPAADAAI